MCLFASSLFLNEAGETRSDGAVRDSHTEAVSTAGSVLRYDAASQSIVGEVPVPASVTATGDIHPP